MANLTSIKKQYELYAGMVTHGKHPPQSQSFFGKNHNWNLILTVDGNASLLLDTKTVKLGYKTLTMIAPGKKRKFFNFDNWTVKFIHFDLNVQILYKPEWEIISPEISQVTLSDNEFAEIVQIFDRVYNLYKLQLLGWYRLAHCMVQEIILYGNMINKKGLDESHIKITSQLLTELKNEKNITLIAKHCGFSRSVFFLKFKETFGMGPQQYREKQLLSKAQTLLEEQSEMTISEIAYTVNFNSAFYFSNRFKKYFGISPKKYRQQYRLSLKTYLE